MFAGQPYMTNSYLIDCGDQSAQTSLRNMEFTGWSNTPIIPELSDEKILKQLQDIQRANGLKPSDKLEKIGRSYNLTIEMETGVGKTYTYIKTIFELNKHYGWTKFIVVVPSVAIREGVYKSFMMTQEHFAEESTIRARHSPKMPARMTFSFSLTKKRRTAANSKPFGQELTPDRCMW